MQNILINNNQAKPASYDIKIWPRQTLLDIAIETDLSLDNLFGLANQKNMSITDALIVGDTIACGKDVYKVFIKKLPASADTQSDEQTALHGIGYDIIEDDFKVW